MARVGYKTKQYEDGTVAVLDRHNTPIEYFETMVEATAHIQELHAQLLAHDPGLEIPEGNPQKQVTKTVRVLHPSLSELEPTVGSKADNVRRAIALVKSENLEVEDAITWGIEKLGMPRSLARTYVLNNWNKA